ncbi:MAG TPA: exosortase/archaeosortase family protein [Drouetiella sp.]
MQTTDSAQQRVDQVLNPVKSQPAEVSSPWLTTCSAMLCINGICCLVVWTTSLGADPIRQVLAGALSAASGFLAWRRVKSQAQTQTQTQTSSFALIACCLIVCVAGNLHTARLYLCANIALILAFTWNFYGWQRCKILLPATFLSMFALPDLPEEFRAYLFIPLQHICTVTAGEIAKLFVPLTYSGHIFTMDGQEMNVAPSCAGLGMWACFLFAFAIWQGFKKYKPSAYIAAFLADPILVVTLNTMRIALTAIVAHYHSMRLALEMHAKMECVLVPLGLFILWKVGAHFADEK